MKNRKECLKKEIKKEKGVRKFYENTWRSFS
jgi:hypothetical protein